MSIQTHAALFSVAALLGLGGCDPSRLVPYINVSAENVCSVFKDRPIKGTADPTTMEVFSNDLSRAFSVIPGGNTTSHLEVKKAVLVAKTGPSDLSFVDSASMIISEGRSSPTLSPLEAVHFQKGVSSGGPDFKLVDGESIPLPTLETKGFAGIDVYPYLRRGPVNLTLVLSGALPVEDWTIDMIVCVGGDVTHTP